MIQKNRGRLIVFEGIDGSGKTTQIKLLERQLIAAGKKVFLTAEPTETVSGGLLRDALSGATKRAPSELAALFLLDRINHNVNPRNGIIKMLNEGYDVICDRYYYSSFAYQGSETNSEWVRRMNLDCADITTPDICIFLDLSPEVSISRIESTRAMVEIYEEQGKLEKVRETYIELFRSLGDKEHIVIVNADRPENEVAAEVYNAVSGC